MNDGLVKIILALIGLLGTIITYVLVPWIKTKLTAEQIKNIKFWVDIAVTGAEQIYQEKGQGVYKKAYVVAFLQEKGFNISEHELDILIESAVKELNIWKQIQ